MSQKAGRKSKRIFISDFETTVFKGQRYTEVWAAATVEMYSDEVKIFHSLPELFDFYLSLDCNILTYFHNLKFDGAFWLSWLITDLKMEQAVDSYGDSPYDVEFRKTRYMKEGTFKYTVSDMGQWYSIVIKKNHHIIEIRDSLKLLPFSVKQIGKGFRTQHQKLEMEYEGMRYAGCPITDAEREYIANDVLVVKEAMEQMYAQGFDKITIGACCMSEFKKSLWFVDMNSPRGSEAYDRIFPNLYDMEIDGREHGVNNAGDWVRKSYRGGWCYLVKGKENQIKRNGTTADVNSLYPSMMSSESGNYYPTGMPTFWTGNYIPDEARKPGRYFFVRFRTRFYIKPGKLPFVQIKRCTLYRGTESLTTSDYYNPKTGTYHKKVRIGDEIIDTRQELTMTMTDYQLLLEHYDLEEFEIMDGCWFHAQIGLFDMYIDKYKQMKITAPTNAIRTIAKLALNNIYGKMASSTNSSFKFAYTKEDSSIGYITVPEYKKKPGYIPCGTAITSYARTFTIRAAQANYHGVDEPGFIYADTDSIHCDLPPEEIKGIRTDDKAFCCWKLESSWDKAIFVRQKTYIEHVVAEDLKPIDNPYNSIKCAGMPDRCKRLLNLSMEGGADPSGYISEGGNRKEWTDDERYFLFDEEGKPIRRTYEDFRIGLCVPGKLLPYRIPGGIVLIETTYEMR
ncbi:MAG: hypothetical protein IKC03_09885 [Oscillospiraceae bacterium]|nr:hypothetical protein [Oscillospiraceae bacterium]